jgi:multiple sugar transport system substrate-binding protein
MSNAQAKPREILLRGVTWDHTRGLLPMIATSQRFHELFPHIDIAWTKRSLQEFADRPMDELVREFDLLVIDHPWVGAACAGGALVDLAGNLPAAFLNDASAHSVGKSYPSYEYDGGLWAIAIDAAAPVSCSRPDLLEKHGLSTPENWEDLIELGRKGLVCCPSIPLDVYCNFLNLCASAGAELFPDETQVVDRSSGREALEKLRELAAVVPASFLAINPIRACEVMTATDDFAYCPFIYGYSNYARPGYARKILTFGATVAVRSGIAPSTMLGGTGLAISAQSENRQTAIEYLKFVADPATQRGIYFQSGGQPGHRSAWIDPDVNRAASGYFSATLPSLDAAFVRPRYAGYVHFQDRAGLPIHSFLCDRSSSSSAVLDQLNLLYRESIAR